MQDGEKNKAPSGPNARDMSKVAVSSWPFVLRYAFVTFRFAADADCAVVDRQDFPGRLSAPCPGADVLCD